MVIWGCEFRWVVVEAGPSNCTNVGRLCKRRVECRCPEGGRHISHWSIPVAFYLLLHAIYPLWKSIWWKSTSATQQQNRHMPRVLECVLNCLISFFSGHICLNIVVNNPYFIVCALSFHKLYDFVAFDQRISDTK